MFYFEDYTNTSELNTLFKDHNTTITVGIQIFETVPETYLEMWVSEFSFGPRNKFGNKTKWYIATLVQSLGHLLELAMYLKVF